MVSNAGWRRIINLTYKGMPVVSTDLIFTSYSQLLSIEPLYISSIEHAQLVGLNCDLQFNFCIVCKDSVRMLEQWEYLHISDCFEMMCLE